MRRILTATLLTSAISSVAIAVATTPASAQMGQMYGADQADSGISLDYFSEQLAPYGYWLYSDRWGLVWQPGDVPYDFHPYLSAGSWVYTDEYGWYWQSSYPWGDIPFHYGRWVNDPDDGWLWIPGYEWSPGWVTWRSNGQYIGWMPMPPDDAFLGGRGVIGFGGFGMSLRFGAGDAGGMYGYSRWYGRQYNEGLFARNWVFVGLGQIGNRDYRAVAVRDPVRVVNIIHQTRNVTNYTVVNNYVVNRSVDIRMVERATGRPIPMVRAATVIRHPNLVATVAVGQRAQMRMRALAPRGTGIANSAPPPPERIVAKLSTRVPPPKAGRPPMHLFNKATVAAPEARARFHGKPAPETGPGAGPGGMTGPNGGPPGQPGGMMGPGGEHPGRERPNGMTGPNGGPPGAGEPGGMTGPAGERPRRQPPNGMNGPNGGPPSDAGQPGGMTGPNNGPPGAGQPGGMTGPTGERPRRQPPNGMNGPNGGPAGTEQPGGMTGPPGERPRRPPPNGMNGPNGGPPSDAGQPDGMTGPNNGPPGAGQPGGMTGPAGERPRRPPPSGMNGPNGGPAGAEQPGGMTGPTGERPRRPPPNGMTGPNGGPPGAEQPGGMTGPAGERPRRPPPDSMNGPNGGPPAGPDEQKAARPRETPPDNVPGKPKKPPPKKEPPENPPQ